MYQERELKKFKILEELKPDEALQKMREITRKPDNYEVYNKCLLKGLTNRGQSKKARDERLIESMSYNPTTKKSVMDTMS